MTDAPKGDTFIFFTTLATYGKREVDLALFHMCDICYSYKTQVARYWRLVSSENGMTRLEDISSLHLSPNNCARKGYNVILIIPLH